jgi:hypothetical protein
MPANPIFAGYYDTTSPVVTDVENSPFTNMGETMPRDFTALRFERGTGRPEPPPVPIDLIRGHLHYYRYSVGGPWATWQPDLTIARWTHVPRRISVDTETARPVWFALRQANSGLCQANSDGLVSIENVGALRPGRPLVFALSCTPRKNRSHKAITNSEFVIDGTIAAFRHDSPSDELVAALLPKLPTVTEPELRHALSRLAGPVFPTPAVQLYENGCLRCFHPDDERCWLGEYTVRQDSTSQWLEVSGALFTIRPIQSVPQAVVGDQQAAGISPLRSHSCVKLALDLSHRSVDHLSQLVNVVGNQGFGGVPAAV